MSGGFSKTFFKHRFLLNTWCGMPALESYSFKHLIQSHLGFAYVLINETSLSQIGLVFETLVFF